MARTHSHTYTLGTGRTRKSPLRPYSRVTHARGGPFNWFPTTNRLNYALNGTPCVPGGSHSNYTAARPPRRKRRVRVSFFAFLFGSGAVNHLRGVRTRHRGHTALTTTFPMSLRLRNINIVMPPSCITYYILDVRVYSPERFAPYR